MAAIELDASKLAREITLTCKITGVRKFKARMWIGTRLIALAAFIMGVGIELEGD